MKAFLLARPSIVWLLLLLNAAFACALTAFGEQPMTAFMTLFPTVIAVTALYVGLRSKAIWVRMRLYVLAKEPKKYWRAIGFWFGFYLFISLIMPVAIYARHVKTLK
jgi:hypothetical protein